MSSSGRFEEVIATLVLAADEPAQIARYSADEARLVLAGGTHVHVFRHGACDDATLVRQMRQVVKEAAQLGIELILAGGPESAARLARKARPTFQSKPINASHVADGGRVKHYRGSFSRGAFGNALDQLKTPVTDDDRAELAARAAEDGELLEADAVEAQAFAAALGGRRPVVTWVLAAVIVAVFALEHLFGGSTTNLTLIRMGALRPDDVYAGEWWRLLSCTFLHAGPVHIGFNVIVLLMLGNFLERLLGPGRFLVLYGASALGGAVASLLFLGERFSVGASGALWGLLAAEAALAYLRPDLLPAALVQTARKAAVTNLVINVANSFRPEVDMAAHFGGGAIGAALLLTGVLTAGLVRVTDAEPRPTPTWIRAGAATSALALGAALVVALAIGRPWTIGAPLTFERREVPGLGLTIELPTSLSLGQSSTYPSGGRGVAFGRLLHEPAIVEVLSFPFTDDVDPDAPGFRDEVLTAIAESLGAPVPGASIVSAPTRTTDHGDNLVEVIRRLDNGGKFAQVVRLGRTHLWRVDVVYPERFASDWAGVARRVALTIRPSTDQPSSI